MVEIDLEDLYTKEQLDNIIEFENTMIKKVWDGYSNQKGVC